MVCWHNCRGNSDKKKKTDLILFREGLEFFLGYEFSRLALSFFLTLYYVCTSYFQKGLVAFFAGRWMPWDGAEEEEEEKEKQLTSFPQLGPHPAAVPTQALFLSFKPFQIFTLAWQFDKLRQMSRLAPWCFHHTGRGTNCKRLLAQR